MKLLRKFLIYSHRYLGIAISLLVVVWFASGIVMMYKGGMPRLSPEERLERLAPVDLSQVKLTPAEAAKIADEESGVAGNGAGGRATLLTLLGRPAYRFAGATVFADNGEVNYGVDLDQSRAVAAGFAGVPVEKVRHEKTIDSIDQWTLVNSRQLPMDKFVVDDAEGTELYVQGSTGEVVVKTTANNRFWSYLGTIPHFMYFTFLREDQPLWYDIVVYSSGAVCVLALLGLLLAPMLLKRPKPFKLSKAIPYSGWMRWHYVTGFVFGVCTLTWAFSGLLSMEPFQWTQSEGLQVRAGIFRGGQLDLNHFGRMDPAAWQSITGGRDIKEVAYVRIDGRDYYDVHVAAASEEYKRERLHQPYYIVGRADEDRLLVDAETLAVRTEPIPVETLVAKIEAAMPDQKIAAYELLQEYDSYYYSRQYLTPLPVLRVKFADPAESWVYIDPQMGSVLSTIPRLARVERWLYNGLHSLDFAFLYDKRPLWDIVMLTLLAGGLMSSTIGLYLGLKRVAKSLAFAKPGAAAEPVRSVEAAHR